MWGEISQENRIGTEGAPSKNNGAKCVEYLVKSVDFIE
jgi:hypothetical protein